MKSVGIRQAARRALVRCGSIIASLSGLFIAGIGSAAAGLDDELSLVDGRSRTLTIQQWDTFLNGVFALDRNRLTREWFHTGRAVYVVTGQDSEAFEGTMELGYQIGYPWSLGVGLNFNYTTPNTSIFYGIPSVFPGGGPDSSFVQTTNLLPSAGINIDASNGPGIQEVATFSVAVTGSKGAVAVSNAHGTVTGAAGGVILRPYARLISAAGDSVTTYGENWDMK